MKEPEAIVQNGIVVNHEQLKRYWAERHDREALIRRGILRDLRDNMPPEPGTVIEPVKVTVRHVIVHDFAARRQVAELEQLRQHVAALEKKQHTKAKSKYT